MKLMFYLLFASFAFASDHSHFRFCKDTGFCRRGKTLRQHFETSTNFVEQTNSRLVLKVENVIEGAVFNATFTALQNDVIRFQMKHIFGGDVLFNRYEVPIEYTLTSEGLTETTLIVENDENTITVKNGKASIRLIAATMEMSYFVGEELITEINKGGTMLFETGKTTDRNGNELDGSGEETFKDQTVTKIHGPSSVAMKYYFPKGHHLYGIPTHTTNLVLKNTTESGYNEPYRLYNVDIFDFDDDSPMSVYGGVPVIYSINSNYSSGVFHNNPSETFVDIDGMECRFLSESGFIDEFFLPGPRPVNVIQEYIHLTGATFKPLKQMLGYHQCRYSYLSQDESNHVIDRLDEAEVPFDVLWLDIDHTDNKKYFTFNNETYPKPLELQQKLDEKGRKLVTIVDPHIAVDDNYYIYSGAKERDYFVKDKSNNVFEGRCWPGTSSYIDFVSEEARKWFSKQYLLENYKYSTKNLFIWNDMDEVSVFDIPENAMPKDSIHSDGLNQYEERDVHNAFGMLYHSCAYKGLSERNEGERVFVLTRSYFAGSQKFGAVWTGDADSTWNKLRGSISQNIGLNMVGILMSGSDVGGFLNNVTTQMLIRWYQLGSFYPFFREHANANTVYREPYLFREEDRRRIIDAIKMRYLFVDYIYQEYIFAIENKEPLFKPLWINYGDDVETEVLEEEFLFGNHVLVAPVVQNTSDYIRVYIPQGVWYNYYKNKKVTNGWNSVYVTMDNIPVYIHGGSVIPMKERIKGSIALMKQEKYTIRIYLDENEEGKGKIFIDDGVTLKEDHLLSEITFKNKEISNTVIEDVNSGTMGVSISIRKIVIIGKQKQEGIEEFEFDDHLNIYYKMLNKNLNENWSIQFN